MKTIEITSIMKKSIILTRAVNDYNQHGEYFVAWFSHPTIEQLLKIFPNNREYCEWLLETGGGRKEVEDEWYYLIEITEGEEYK